MRQESKLKKYQPPNSPDEAIKRLKKQINYMVNFENVDTQAFYIASKEAKKLIAYLEGHFKLTNTPTAHTMLAPENATTDNNQNDGEK